MTRYAFAKQPKGVWDVIKHQDGPWMLFADHDKIVSEQRALIEQQAMEIARLEKVIDRMETAYVEEHP